MYVETPEGLEKRHRISALIAEGKSVKEAAQEVGVTSEYVYKLRKQGKLTLTNPEEPIPPTDPPGGNGNKPPGTPLRSAAEIARNKLPKEEKKEDPAKLPKLTTETVSATALQLIPQVQQVPLSPGIYNGYLCAKIRGFSGTIADWLELASVNFWTVRGHNPFAIVGGYVSRENEGGQDGGQGKDASVGAGTGERSES